MTSSCGNNKKAFSSGDHSELFSFVKKSVEIFQVECPYSICDGLFRVDVFMNRSNELVVNEFESLEAAYYCSKGSLESAVTNFLKTYWLDKLTSLDIIKHLLNHSTELSSNRKESAENSRKTKRSRRI